MNLMDRARIEWAVQSYGQWIDLRGAPRRRRRDMRRELRSNLGEAAAHTGAREAVKALGSRRQMAAEALPVDPTRPRWFAAANYAIAAFGIVLLVEWLCALAWLDGAMEADEKTATAGAMTLFPGSSVEYEPLQNGFSLAFQPGWLCLALGLLTYVIVARPWRLFTKRRSANGQSVKDAVAA